MSDLIVGAPSSQDRGYLVYGKAEPQPLNGTFHVSQIGSTISGATILDTSPGGGFASSTAGLDFNGDGLTDLVFGHEDANNSHGRVYVIYGQQGAGTPVNFTVDGIGSSIPGFIIDGPTPDFTAFAHDVANAGDLDGDGADDLLIGAFSSSAGGSEAGQAFLLYGVRGASQLSGHYFASDIGQLLAGAVFNGAHRNDRAGAYVSGAGDINGDGANDLLIGAPLSQSPSGSSAAGNAYLVYGIVVPEPTAMHLNAVVTGVLVICRGYCSRRFATTGMRNLL